MKKAFLKHNYFTFSQPVLLNNFFAKNKLGLYLNTDLYTFLSLCITASSAQPIHQFLTAKLIL